MIHVGQSQWPCGLRHRCTTACLLGLWVQILMGAWMSLCCEYCVLSGRGLFDALIMRPEESYWLWCVIVCDLGTSRMRRPWTVLGRSATGAKKNVILYYKVWNTHTHTHTCVCVCTYIYIYIYIYVSTQYVYTYISVLIYAVIYKCGRTPYTNFVRW